jgi:hypothetical protein
MTGRQWLPACIERRLRVAGVHIGPPAIPTCLKKRSWLVIRYRLEAYATLRRGLIAMGMRKRLQEDLPTSRAAPESKVA